MKSIIFLISFSVAMMLFFYLGNVIKSLRRAAFPEDKKIRNKLVEGVIFALLGLMIAFAFSGAHERFETRRALVVEEANTIETAYYLLQLFSNQDRATLQNYFKQYINLRIAIYKKLPYLGEIKTQMLDSGNLEIKIRSMAIHTCESEKSSAACIVELPVINKMIEIANTRTVMTQIHPPVIVIFILIGLALCSAILLGYSMKQVKFWHSAHMLVYILVMTFVIFAIIDLEYPRFGFIHANYFDDLLIDLRNKIDTVN